MKAYRVSTGRAPLIHNLSTSRMRVVNVTHRSLCLRERNAVPNEYKAEWMFRRRKDLLSLTRFEPRTTQNVA
jgi:hypothetical protein